MLIRTKLALHLSLQVVLVGAMMAALLHLAMSYKHLGEVQARRLEARELAGEMQKSSDDLTLMARLFVVTREPRYAEYFREISRMRDGLVARPRHDDGFYWDMVLAEPGLRQARGQGRESSLSERIRQAGFAADELALLDAAKRRSDALLAVEEQAIGMVDTRGSAQSLSDEEWRQALELVHGAAYRQAKAEIMRPLREFHQLLEQRLSAQREATEQQISWAIWLAAGVAMVLFLHALLLFYNFDRSVRHPLEVLRRWAQAVRVGRHGSRTKLQDSSEFGELSAVIDEMAESVERSLAELKDEVAKRTRAEEVVRHLANHDALTGLPSLRLLHDRLDRALAHAQRHQQGLALMFVDLNGFKPVNDRYGHESGDVVLKAMAQRLAAGLRDADTVGRVGGDEFLIILPEVASHEAAALVREKLVAALAAPVFLAQHHVAVHVSAAMGIAIFPDDARDMQDLLRAADQDMYKVKAEMQKAPTGPG